MTALFLRLLPYDDKATVLTEAVTAVREGRSLNPVVHAVDPASFRQVPGSPFAYWVSERIRRLFTELSPFQREGRIAQHGASTKDDFRFVRLWWEVAPERILTGTASTTLEEFREQTFASEPWVPFAKGGAYSPYYADIHLVLDWESDGGKIEKYLLQKYPYLSGNANWVLHRECHYFCPGLTWPRRTTSGISIRILPRGCIFADKGPTAFASDRELVCLLALMNSQVFEGFVILRLGAADAAARSYEVGIIQETPVPHLSCPDGEQIGKLAYSAVNLKRDLDRANETSHVFHLPALLQVGANLVFAQSSKIGRSQGSPLRERIVAWQGHVAETERQLAEYQREIDDITFRLYGIEGDDRQAIEEVTKGVTSGEWQVTSEEGSEDNDAEEDTEDQILVTRYSLLIYFPTPSAASSAAGTCALPQANSKLPNCLTRSLLFRFIPRECSYPN